MGKLIGNYKIAGQSDAASAPSDPEKKEETVAEFERRAMEHLGGSIAFVMKGKDVLWNGTASKQNQKKT